MTMTIRILDLSRWGTEVGTRALAKEIQLDLLKELSGTPSSKVVFDMSRVQSVSAGFAHELFGGLLKSLGEDFKKRVGFRFGDSQTTVAVRSVINAALSSVLSERQPLQAKAK